MPEASDWFARGDELEENLDYDRALESYRKAVELDPENPKYLSALAGALFETGRYEEAVEVEKELHRLGPADWRRLNMIGQTLLYHLDQPDEALDWYERAAALEPDVLPPHVGAVSALAMMGQAAEALRRVRHLRERFTSSKEGAWLHSVEGEIFEASGELSAAAQAYRKAVDLAGTSWDAMRKLTDVLLRLERWDEAEESLSREIREWGDRHGLRRSFGFVREMLGKRDLAAQDYRGAIELDEHRLGLILMRLDREGGHVEGPTQEILRGLSGWPIASDLEAAVVCVLIGDRLSFSRPTLARGFYRAAIEFGYPFSERLERRIEALEARMRLIR